MTFDPAGLTAYVNGEFVDATQASVSIFDHGFLYGDGVFEGMRALIVETPGDAPPGTYRLGADDAAIEGVDGASQEIEEIMDVARRTLAAAREGVPSALWVVATPGLELLPEDVVEAKLTALAEGARQARLYLAKEQFDI